MKIISSLFLAGFFMVSQAGMVFADTKTFTVSAAIPLATSVNMAATSIKSSTGARTAVTSSALSFNPLTFNSANQIWLPDHFYSVDVTPGGAGSTDVTLAYTEGANPNTPGHGLGWKSTATFMKVVGSTETALTTHGPKKMLKDLTAEHVTPAQLGTGFLRVYLGIVTKDPAAVPLDPATSEVFTNADKPGSYDGSLVITATIV